MSSKVNNFSNSLTGFILSFQMFLVKPQFWINNHPPIQYLHKIAAESHKIVQSGPSIFCLYTTSLQAPELPQAPARQCFPHLLPQRRLKSSEGNSTSHHFPSKFKRAEAHLFRDSSLSFIYSLSASDLASA